MAELTREQGSAALVGALTADPRGYLSSTRSSATGYAPQQIMTAQNYQGPTSYGGGYSMAGYSPVNLFPMQMGLQYTDLGSALGGAMSDMYTMNSQNQQAGNEMALQQQKLGLLQSLLGGGAGGAFGAVGGGTGGINYYDTASRQQVGGNYGGGGQAGGGGGASGGAGYYDGNNQWVAPAANGGGAGGYAYGGQQQAGQPQRTATVKWTARPGSGLQSGYVNVDPRAPKMDNAKKIQQAVHGY